MHKVLNKYDHCRCTGYGSKLNAAGELEMDAIIMEGKSLNSGAVACVRDIKNPIKLARKVLEKVRKTLGTVATIHS